jgi:hypothetical protein
MQCCLCNKLEINKITGYPVEHGTSDKEVIMAICCSDCVNELMRKGVAFVPWEGREALDEYILRRNQPETLTIKRRRRI